MKINVENITEEIQTSRPNLKPNTVKQYESNLTKLKKMFETDTYDFLDDPEKVAEKISHLHFTSQRNHYNAIIVLLMALNSEKKYDKLIEKYSDTRDELNTKYIESNKSSTISDKQSKNFASMDEINTMISKVADELKGMKLKKKENLSKKEFALLQFFVLANLYSKMPLRNDYALMESITPSALKKMGEEQKDKNWLLIEKNNLSFILNNYKSNKTYGQKRIPIEDKDLKRLLRYFLKVTGSGALFKSSTGAPISRNGLTQFLKKYTEKYMGKSVGSTLFRKSYLSDKYSDVKSEMEKDANMMGNSVATQQSVYVKKPQEE